MKRLYREMVRLLEQGESFAVATIFDKVGSAPRSAGAKMVVRADGSIFGTIGGGRLEADAMRLAREALLARRTLVHKFDLTGKDVAAMDMICGGAGEVLIEFVDANDPNNRIVCEAAADVLERGAKAWLITALSEKPNGGGLAAQQCLVGGGQDPDRQGRLRSLPAGEAHRGAGEDLHARGSVRGPALPGRSAASDRNGLSLRRRSSVAAHCAVEPKRRLSHGGPGRPPGLRQSRAVPRARRDRSRSNSFDRLPALPIDENSYLVIVTRGHLYDGVVLKQVLRSGAAYIGMIGSRSKRDLIFKDMISQGFREEELARVHAPIGTNIGAETPEELAVSIVGELIQVRAKREGVERKASDSASGACCRILAAGERV